MTPTRSIGATNARTHFYRLLDKVAGGEPVAITKRGRPVARLIPIEPATSDPDQVLEWMRTFRAGNTLGGLSIRELIDEGRKY